MRLSRWTGLPALALGSCGLFAAALALVLTRAAPLPVAVIVGLAALAFGTSAAMAIRSALRLLRGPAERFDAERAVRCDAAGAVRVRERAVRRDPGGGAGYVRRWAAAFPVVAWLAACGVLTAGLLNFAMRAEGTWIQYAESGRDLDQRQTYRDLDLGLLADPSQLRFGVLVGAIRPRDPSRLLDLQVVDSTGRLVRDGALGAGQATSVAGIALYQWAMGPGIHLTVIHQEKGRLFDEPVPLWPAGGGGAYAETLRSGNLELHVRVDGWPWPDEASGTANVTLRDGPQVLFEGVVEPRKVYPAREGYGIITWETRPYVGLGVAHRTYRQLSAASLAVLVTALVLWAFVRAAPFRYREEEDGGVAVFPPDAWAKLSVRR